MYFSLAHGGCLSTELGRHLEGGTSIAEPASYFVQLVGALDYCHRTGATFCASDVPPPCLDVARGHATNMPLTAARSQTHGCVCDRLKPLHTAGVIHGDIKTDNLVFADAARTRLLLVDFGCAATTNELSGFRGSLHYCAPEVRPRAAAALEPREDATARGPCHLGQARLCHAIQNRGSCVLNVATCVNTA